MTSRKCWTTTWLRLPLLVLAIGACGRGQETAAVEGGAAGPGAVRTISTAPGAGDAARAELPPKIYYDLTRYEWYAQAQPLVHADQSYAVTGAPIPIALAQLQRAGEYQGVEYYTRGGAADQVMYVPVYEGYWLRFAKSLPTGSAVTD